MSFTLVSHLYHTSETLRRGRTRKWTKTRAGMYCCSSREKKEALSLKRDLMEDLLTVVQSLDHLKTGRDETVRRGQRKKKTKAERVSPSR